MLEEDVPTKTEQGQNEISQRSRKLSPRQRMLLISINGNARVADLRKQFGAFGDFDEVIRQLAEFDLIHLPSALKPATPIAAATAPGAPPVAAVPTSPDDAGALAGDSAASAPAAESESSTGVIAAKQLMSETAFATLGLRAYMFTLKLEHCHSAEELRLLLPDFEHLLSRAKGEEFASALSARLRHMLADET